MRIRAAVKAGESVVVQETWDPGWHAYAGGRALEVRKDPVGYMEIAAQPGEQEIRLVFELPLENMIGRIIAVLSGVILLAYPFAVTQSRRRTSPEASRQSAPPDARP
jgi:uncharacterized membrane protein YfhO